MLNPEVLKCHEDLITLDTYAQQGKTTDNKFYIYVKTYLYLWLYGGFMGQNVKTKCIFWGYFGGPEGVFNDQTRPILLSSYPITHIYVHMK